MNICYLNTTKTEDGIPPSLLDELCQQSPPNVQFINSWCVSKTVIMAKKSCKGVSGNFFQTNPSRALSFCRLYHFFSQKKPPPAAGGAVTAGCAVSVFGLGGKGVLALAAAGGPGAGRNLGVFPWHGELAFSPSLKKGVFLFSLKRSKTWKINEKHENQKNNSTWLLFVEAFCILFRGHTSITMHSWTALFWATA